MKKLFGIMTAMLLILSVIPVIAVNTGTGIGIDITPEAFAPRIWMCDSRAVLEDCVEEGRVTNCATSLDERIENYAFEGEQIQWDVLVMDKNKIEQIQEVVGTIGSSQGEGNDIEVECRKIVAAAIPLSCNARIDEQPLTVWDSDVMAMYTCTFTVETPDSMYGEYFLTAEAIGADGLSATMDENEYWFLNPTVALKVDGDLTFSDVRPGSVSYSDTLLVGNDADEGSGVLLDMFISGTDFYDPSPSDAKCPTSNRLKLSQDARSQASLGANLASRVNVSTNDCNVDTANIIATFTGLSGVDNNDHLCYFATNGAYSTLTDGRADPEGYVPIVYSDEFTRDFYNDAEIIVEGGMAPSLSIGGGLYHHGNVLSPGAEQAITFKLGLPEPCIGDFSAGQIYFWGEAI